MELYQVKDDPTRFRFVEGERVYPLVTNIQPELNFSRVQSVKKYYAYEHIEDPKYKQEQWELIGTYNG